MNIVNLTPHAIVVWTPEGGNVSFPPSGVVARVTSMQGTVEEIEGVRIAGADSPGEVTGLPAPVPGTWLLVSGMVGAACRRIDVLVPGTGPDDGPVRNDKGQIVAVTRLKRVV